MRRAIVVGGFGCSEGTVERVCGALRGRFSNVKGFTFSGADRNFQRLGELADGASVFTYSAGIVNGTRAIEKTGSQPREIVAICPVLRQGRAEIMARTAYRMLFPETIPVDAHERRVAGRYVTSSSLEQVAHPWGNLGKFISGDLSRFDAVDYAVGSITPTTLAFGERDGYYRPSQDQRERCKRAGVEIVDLSGGHDQLPLSPRETLEELLEKSGITA